MQKFLKLLTSLISISSSRLKRLSFNLWMKDARGGEGGRGGEQHGIIMTINKPQDGDIFLPLFRAHRRCIIKKQAFMFLKYFYSHIMFEKWA